MSESDAVWSALVLNQMEGLGPIRVHQLIQKFETPEKVLEAGPALWGAVLEENDLAEKLGRELDRYKKFADREIKEAQKSGIHFWISTQKSFPARLREIRIPPLLLYVRGNIEPENIDAIALVGSRRCTYYGSRVAKKLTQGLAAAGFATVSGLARGIDSVVHEETLAANGKTIGVVGCGLDQCYPPEHRNLMDRISDSGAILSEFSLGAMPLPGNFPRRNRIIAGLSRGTVVVEGTLRSGSLITARIAAQEGRDVFAVPGPVTSLMSEAPNMLIQQGAILTRDVNDILEILGQPLLINHESKHESNQSRYLTEGEKKIFSMLESETLHREELAEQLGLPPEQTSELLIRLELEGSIRSLPGGYLSRV